MNIEKSILFSLEYVKTKLCKDGGYSFYRHPYLEESSIYDTYYAVRSLLMFGEKVEDITIDYIIKSFVDADTLEKHYYAIRSLELIKEDPRHYKSNINLKLSITTKVSALEDVNLEFLRILMYKRIDRYYSVWKGFIDEISILSDTLKQNKYIDIKTISLFYAISGELIENDLEKYGSQNFGITPLPSLSYTDISTLYAGYWLLKALNKPLYNIDIAKNIILKSQDKYGAFPEKEEALPDLRTNFCGLYVLHLC